MDKRYFRLDQNSKSCKFEHMYHLQFIQTMASSAVQCRHISIDVSHVFRDTCVCKRRNSCRRNPLLMACYTQQNSRRALLHYCFWQILHKCQIAGSACKAICSNSCVCMCAICTCRIFIHFIFPRCLLFLMLHYACADAQLR